LLGNDVRYSSFDTRPKLFDGGVLSAGESRWPDDRRMLDRADETAALWGRSMKIEQTASASIKDKINGRD
jgi:hypothetical protein